MISKLFKWAAAITCALPLVAGAETVGDWFSGGVENDAAIATSASWQTKGVDVSSELAVDNGKIVVGNNGADTLDLVPTVAAPDTNVLTRVIINSTFPPNEYEELDSVVDAKTALTLAIDAGGNTNYYAHTGSTWVKLFGANPPASDEEVVTAIVELNAYETSVTASFKIGDNWLTDENNTTNIVLSTTQANVTKVSFAGSCLLESVDTKMQLGVASVDGIKYPTYVDAIKASKTATDPTITVLRESYGETIGAGNLANYSDINGVLTAIVDWSPWAYSSGIVVWRATSGQLFHASTVADVGEYGQIGESYTLTNGGAHPWQIFASNQSAYSAPGATLVFDEAGYNNNSDAQFAPMSFGGMWVKALQAENTPYCITDTTSSAARQVELGAANTNTYFKFDESFTFNRNSATKVLGTATVDIASGATFTINARANKGALVESGNTLVLKGEGTLAVVGGLNVSGTLDLSAATVPTIDGDVTLNAGSTIILPAGTETGSAINVAVCSETLAASGLINVQIGDADAVQALLTVSGGAITRIEVGATYTATVDGDTTFSAIEWQKGGEAAELPGNLALAALEISGSGTVTGLSDVPASVTLASGVTLDVTAIASSFADLTKSSAGTYMFTDNYPLSVPQGYTYEYVGGSTEAETATISGDRLNNSGNLKTSGYLAIDDFWTAWTTASLEVLDGKTTVGANNDKALRGTVTIRASAELVNAKTADALAYGATTVVNVYGTLSMGETRWTVGGSNTINVYGGTITGVGQGTNGALDFMDTSSLNADETSEISASIRFRNALTSVTVAENKTLTLSGVIRCQYAGGGVTKQGKGNLTFTTAPNALQAGIVHKDGHLVFNTQDDVTLTVTYNTAKTDSTSLWYATQSNWKGTVKIDSLTGNLSWLTGAGNADSTISMQNVSNAYVMAAGYTTYSLPGTLSIDAPVEFNNGSSGSTVNITNLAGSSTLVLGSWGGCSSARYNLLNVDVDNGWTGTLVVSNGITRGGGGTFTVGIGNIETANTTPGRCVLPITNVELEGHTGTVAYNIDNATLNGNPASFEVKTDGIYLASLVTVTVPAIANTTVTVKIGEETIGTAAGNYDVAPGSVVTVTYAAAEGYQISGQTVYTINTANSETTFTPSAQVAQIVAYIGETPYTSLASAFSAVDEGDTLTLVGSAVTLADDVTVSASYTLAGDAEGTTVTGAGKIYLTGSAELTLDATLTSVGNQFWFSSKDAKLTFPTAGTPPTVRPYTAGGCQTGTTVNGDGTTTYYQYLFLTLQVGASNVTLAYDGSGEPVVMKQVYEGDELVFTATPNAGYENPVVTVNGEPLSPVDGKYTVVVGTVNVAIQATATAIPPVAQVEHGETVTPYLTLAAAVAAAEDGDTVRLLANAYMPSVEFADKYGVSSAQGDSEIVINKAITLDGAGNTIYGLANYFTHEMADGCHDLFISGNKDVTIKNVTLSDFGGSAYVSKFTYPIWVGQGYTGTLTLDGVTVTNYNRTAFNFNGGTVVVTNCTVVGDAPTPRNTNGAYFQNGIGVLNANVTVYDSTFSGIGAYDPDYADSNAAECFQVVGTGSITVTSGSYSGQYVAIVGCNATGSITLNGGDFEGVLNVEEGSTGSLAVSGGTFDRQVPAAYCASGKVPTTTPDASGKYTVVDKPSDIDPTSGTEIVVDPSKTPEQQAADAQAAAAAMDVKKTAEAEAASVDQTTWNGYFTKTAEKVNDVWVAKAELNPAVVLPVDGAEETPLTDMLESVAAAAVDTTGKTAAEVPTKAGLYYWISGATEVNAASYTPGTAVLGDGTTQALARPTLTGENGKAFFKVCVDIVAPTQD